MPTFDNTTSSDAADVTPMPLLALSKFRRLMQNEGSIVDLARMCLDRHYALERLAQAHASANEPLRRVAVELFSTSDRNAGIGRFH